jgi:transposase InsO family protein
MNREFSASLPDEKWCIDVTEFKYGVRRKVYLSAIIELYVAYRTGRSNTGLVFQTIIHSDRGYQYASKGFKRMIEEAGLTHSMSRVGCWGTLKVEMYHLREFQAYNRSTTTIISKND